MPQQERMFYSILQSIVYTLIEFHPAKPSTQCLPKNIRYKVFDTFISFQEKTKALSTCSLTRLFSTPYLYYAKKKLSLYILHILISVIFCSKNACLWIFQLKVLDISKNFVQRFSTFVQKIKKYQDVFHKTCPGFLQSTCSIYKKI